MCAGNHQEQMGFSLCVGAEVSKLSISFFFFLKKKKKPMMTMTTTITTTITTRYLTMTH